MGDKTWSKKPVIWTNGKTAYISVVFTWHLKSAKDAATELLHKGYTVHIGGPAAVLNADYFDDIPATVNLMSSLVDTDRDVVFKHNPNATFTSRGCVRRCPFCAVPRIEGDLIELSEWPVRRIICDNNLLACSQTHFDDVIDKLKGVPKVDFNQGLDARLLTKHHAQRLTELDCLIRLAWDDTAYESRFNRAYSILMNAGIPAKKIQVYVLIGYNDTPDDALYRLRTVWSRGSFPNPMRYQPLDALKKNSYVGDSWTDEELKRYTRYWSRLFWFDVRYKIPFEEYTLDKEKRRGKTE